MYICREIAARIAAVPSIGHDSPWAECGMARRTKSLGTCSKWLVSCNITVELSSMLKELGLLGNLTHEAGSDPLSARDDSCGQSHHDKGALMATIIAILDFLFGCHHAHFSRVFTLQ